MNREQLLAMTMPDLVRYANEQFGLGVTKDYNQFDLVNQIEQSMRKFKGNALMRVVKDGDEGRVGPGMMKIRIRPGKYDRIPRPVIIGHQFKIASVPVNRDVILPARYLVCFEDAVQDVYFTDETTKEWVCQEEHAYSYSVLEMGPKVAPRAVAASNAAVKRPINKEPVDEFPDFDDKEHYGLPPAPVPEPAKEDALLKAVLAMGQQLEAMSNRLEKVEASKTTKPTPVKKKVAAKKVTQVKEES